jgi:two-component system KDP operon response regulator KdpE
LSFKPAQSFPPLVPPSTFLGKHVEDVMPADMAPSIMAAIRACLRSGQTQTLVYQLVEEGQVKDYEARVLPIEPNEVLAIVRDCTDQRRRERAEYEERRAASGESDTAYLTVHGPRRRGEKSVVLIVDPDVQALRFLRRFLEHAGHKPIVTSDAEEAVRLAELETPDLILLDVTLPGPGGDGLLRELRTMSQAPIVVLIPAEREEEAVDALRMGADDYIRKPISPPELKARIEAALRRRRAYAVPTAERLELGGLAIDRAARLVTVGGSVVTLTPTEYGLLSELADSAGRVMTHDEILERVWGPGYAGNHDLLRSFVGSLRKKLGDDPNDPKFVRSERGVGYRLVKPVQ